MRRWTPAFGLLLWVGGCGPIRGEAELVDACEGEDCTPCEQDDECVIVHNSCAEYASCGHADDELMVTQIGCAEAMSFGTPDPERCVCEDVCTAIE